MYLTFNKNCTLEKNVWFCVCKCVFVRESISIYAITIYWCWCGRCDFIFCLWWFVNYSGALLLQTKKTSNTHTMVFFLSFWRLSTIGHRTQCYLLFFHLRLHRMQASRIFLPRNIYVGTIVLNAGRCKEKKTPACHTLSSYNAIVLRSRSPAHWSPYRRWAHALICATVDRNAYAWVYWYFLYIYISVCTIYLVHIHALTSGIYHVPLHKNVVDELFIYVESIWNVCSKLVVLAAVQLKCCRNTSQSRIPTPKNMK